MLVDFYRDARKWYSGSMPKKPAPKPAKPAKPRSGRRGDPVSIYPLKPDDVLRAVLQIGPADVKEILASRPGKKAKGK